MAGSASDAAPSTAASPTAAGQPPRGPVTRLGARRRRTWPTGRYRGAVRRGVGAGPPRRLDAVGLVEHDLAQPHGLRRHLDALVLAQELERLVERQRAVGHEAHEHLGGGGADVRELLLARGVDVEVVGARVLADDHALVDLLAGADEQRPALLEVHQRELRRAPAAVGDQRAGRPRAQLAGPRLPAVEDVVQQAGAARLGEELGAEADQAAGGDEVLHAHPAGAVVDHLLEARPCAARAAG